MQRVHKTDPKHDPQTAGGGSSRARLATLGTLGGNASDAIDHRTQRKSAARMYVLNCWCDICFAPHRPRPRTDMVRGVDICSIRAPKGT